MKFTSLRARLLAWLLVPLALFCALDTWIVYLDARETAIAAQDRMLVGSARMIAEQVTIDDGVLQSVIPPAALELFQSNARDRVYYRVVGPGNTLLSGYPELPPPPVRVASEDGVTFDAQFRGEAIRIAAFSQPVLGAKNDVHVLVEVGETLHATREIARRVWLLGLAQRAAIVALTAVLAWIALHRGLAPVLRLRDVMRARQPGSLEPVVIDRAPSELTPMIDAINDYLRRLDEHVAARTRFIANAAHQLRTPLTVLNTQVTYAIRSAHAQARDETLGAIQRSVRQGMRLVQQLLTLSTAERRPNQPMRGHATDLVGIARRVLEDLAALAQSKQVDLGIEHDAPQALVTGSPAMLYELLRNLVDNALRYGRSGGVVTVGLVHVDAQPPVEGAIVLTVDDDGPGIPPAQRERVFERFQRLGGSDSEGCGLGLSIVREIADASDATVTLDEPPHGHGLRVAVRFPLAAMRSPDHVSASTTA